MDVVAHPMEEWTLPLGKGESKALTDEVLERKNASNQRYVFCLVRISQIGHFYNPIRYKVGTLERIGWSLFF